MGEEWSSADLDQFRANRALTAVLPSESGPWVGDRFIVGGSAWLKRSRWLPTREELIATLRDELASRVREVAELHEVILAQAKALEVCVAPQLPDEPRKKMLETAASALPANEAAAQVSAPSRSFWVRVRGILRGV